MRVYVWWGRTGGQEPRRIGARGVLEGGEEKEGRGVLKGWWEGEKGGNYATILNVSQSKKALKEKPRKKWAGALHNPPSSPPYITFFRYGSLDSTAYNFPSH